VKKTILFSLLALVLFACNDEKKAKVSKNEPIAEVHQELYGFWVGEFVATEAKSEDDWLNNKINIAIKSIAGKKVIAQSVVAGNKRPLIGTMDTVNNQLSFVLAEPGDDKYDGKFEFKLANDTLIGTWKAYNKNIKVTARSFKLVRKAFKYDAQLMLPERDYLDYFSGKDSTLTDTVDGTAEIYVEKYFRAASEKVYEINSSTHQLSEQELKNLKRLDLEILRNTIFARHGYTFKKRSYRQFFDYVDWYVPVTDNVEPALTAIEKSNIKLLATFEKYATDNYDTFGR
jgi:hypothetical protein